MALSTKEKKLIKNTGILAIGTLLSKVLSFFLIPLYTMFLATDDYGRVDVLQTIAHLLIPLISLELTSAVFRYLIECNEENEKKEIISTITCIQIVNCIISFLVSLIVNLLIPIDHYYLFVLYLITMIILNHFQYIIRGFSNNKLFSIISLISASIVLILNIMFISIFRWRAESILLASIIANSVSIIISSFCIQVWKYFDIKSFSFRKLKKMLNYSLPLIPNAISWWIANTSDRLIIRFFIGSYANGIYAVANKIPAIYTSIFSVYNLALVESVSKEAKNVEFEEYINSIFKKSFKLFGCICLLIIISVSIASKIILGKNYISAYTHIYILMIAIFFNSLCSIIGSILTGLKDSKTIGLTTTIGAIVNIIVNFALVKFIGLYAASISTLVSYIIIFIYRYKRLTKYIKLEFPIKYIINLLILLPIITCTYFYNNIIISLIIMICICLMSYFSNKELIKGIISQLIKKINNKEN